MAEGHYTLSVRQTWPFAAACLLSLILLVESFSPNYLSVLTADRGRMAAALTARPDVQAPGYRRCLDRAGELTPRGASVAVLVPWRRWDPAYAYAYYRATYLLTGRRVVPLLDRHHVPHLERLRTSEWVVSWQVPLPESELSQIDRNGDCIVARVR